MPRVPLVAVRAFEAVVRLGSVSKAAAELNVSTSAVSHQLRYLEDWLGIQLLKKEGRGVTPTPAGRIFAITLGNAFGAIETAAAALRQSRDTPVLTVASIPSFATRWLVPLLPEYQREYPGVDIRVIYEPLAELSGFDRAEVVIRRLDADKARDSGAELLLPGWTAPVCSPELIQKRGPFLSLTDIARVPLLHDADRLSWRTWMEAAGLDPMLAEAGTIFEDFHLLSVAAAAGHGVALCPVSMIGEELRSGRLVVLSDVAGNESRGYYVVVAPTRPPHAVTFAGWLRNAVVERLARGATNA
jgi:DNA-binding transcriptional LysR family regulator